MTRTVLGLPFDAVTVAVTMIRLMMLDMFGVFRKVLDENKIAVVDRIIDDVEKTNVHSDGFGSAGAVMEDDSGYADTELGKIAEELVGERF